MAEEGQYIGILVYWFIGMYVRLDVNVVVIVGLLSNTQV